MRVLAILLTAVLAGVCVWALSTHEARLAQARFTSGELGRPGLPAPR